MASATDLIYVLYFQPPDFNFHSLIYLTSAYEIINNWKIGKIVKVIMKNKIPYSFTPSRETSLLHVFFIFVILSIRVNSKGNEFDPRGVNTFI